MTQLCFEYNLEKDVRNFLAGLNSVNNKTHTELQKEYEAIHGSNFSENLVRNFLEIKGKGLLFNKKIKEIEEEWESIEEEFFSRCEKLFGIELPSPIIGYLSQNQRCTYKWKENHFFIYLNTTHPNKIIMHELFHFFTHHKYDSLGLEKQKFNDVKESLTVLLNIDFADLLGDAEDIGYPQHQTMRKEITYMRSKNTSLDEIVRNLALSAL